MNEEITDGGLERGCGDELQGMKEGDRRVALLVVQEELPAEGGGGYKSRAGREIRRTNPLGQSVTQGLALWLGEGNFLVVGGAERLRCSRREAL